MKTSAVRSAAAVAPPAQAEARTVFGAVGDLRRPHP
jgi:hypothetical protein